MKKLLLIGAVIGAVFGAKKLHARVQQNGGVKPVTRKARRLAKRQLRQARKTARNSFNKATVTSLAAVSKVLGTPGSDDANLKQAAKSAS